MAIINETVKKIKNKVVDTTSDVLADVVFGGAKAKREMKKSNDILPDLKLVNQAKGTQDGGDYSDPLFRARARVSNFKVDQEFKNKKLKTAKDVMNKPSDYQTDYAKMRGGK